MNKDTGGTAFPGKALKYAPGEVSNQVAIYENSSGMTLRDYFAAQAMAAYIAANPENQDARLAGLAYGTADAMLAERAK